MNYQKEYIKILKDIYEQRKKLNNSYSVMAFSRDAGFKSYHMSDVLKGRYGLSHKRSEKVAINLKMSKKIRLQFTLLTTAAHSKSKTEVEFAISELNKFSLNPDFYLDHQTFDLISSWEYLAILELARSKNFRPEAKVISQKLSISEVKAKECLNKLIQLALINEKNKVNDKKMVYLLNQTKSLSVRNYHKQNFKKACQALTELNSSERYAFTQNHLLTKEEYDTVSKKIHKVVTDYFMELENNRDLTESDNRLLYCFTSCLFPLETI